MVKSLTKAVFRNRECCITCGGRNLKTLSRGRFTNEPLRGFLEKDPWGVSPLPFVEHETWEFVQCADCSQKFHKRILNDEWLDICYSEWISAESIEAFHLALGADAKLERAKHFIERALLVEKSTRSLRGADDPKILDYGCGDGDFLACCELMGFECTGVDFSDARRKRRKTSFYPSLEDLASDYDSDAPAFDAITMFEVLEHLAEPLETLRSLTKLLKKGGVFILETPNCKTVVDIKSKQDYRLIHPLSHINGFTAETMKTIAAAAGLQPLSPGTAQVSADFKRVVKREVRRLVQPFRPQGTQMFFYKA